MRATARLAIACALLGCAAAEPTMPIPGPVVLRDARTGFELVVPEGWSLAPSQFIETESAQMRLGTLLFVLLDERSTGRGEVEMLVAIAGSLAPVPLHTDQLDCAALGKTDLDLHAVEARPPLTIGSVELCAFRGLDLDARPVYLWSTLVGADRLTFFSNVSDAGVEELERMLATGSFE